MQNLPEYRLLQNERDLFEQLFRRGGYDESQRLVGWLDFCRYRDVLKRNYNDRLAATLYAEMQLACYWQPYDPFKGNAARRAAYDTGILEFADRSYKHMIRNDHQEFAHAVRRCGLLERRL